MKKQNLILYRTKNEELRTVFKTKHSRIIYLKLMRHDSMYTIIKCYYLDRSTGGKYNAVPQKLVTKEFLHSDLIKVISSELDKKFFELEICSLYEHMPEELFIKTMLHELRSGYKFLIFVGEGKMVNGMPEKLITRLKNKIHRSIYLSLYHYGEDKGVIEACYYYDRVYKSKSQYTPNTLSSVFFDYNKKAILDVVNNELNCDFTDIIFIFDNSINIESNETPLCGNI